MNDVETHKKILYLSLVPKKSPQKYKKFKNDYFPNSAPSGHFYRPVFGPFCNGYMGGPSHAQIDQKPEHHTSADR